MKSLKKIKLGEKLFEFIDEGLSKSQLSQIELYSLLCGYVYGEDRCGGDFCGCHGCIPIDIPPQLCPDNICFVDIF